MKYLTTPQFRSWVYLITCAALGVVSVYGFIDERQLAAWTSLGAAITAMAWINTPMTKDDESDELIEGRRYEDE